MAYKYKIIAEMFTDNLSVRVNRALHEGWELHGSPFILKDNLIGQAVVIQSQETHSQPPEPKE